MIQTIMKSRNIQDRIILSSLVTAILATLFLFYIDEGYYDFRWMTNAGNWICFIVYSSAIFMVFYLVSQVVLRTYRLIRKFVS